ncbi:MAG: flagellar biosynthesis protein FlhA [Desulfobacterales bacterium]|nr:flagellar biosynthesis protein FlhA [Desulfobacterales bacterium]
MPGAIPDIAKKTDFIMPMGVVGILMIMIMPLPTFLLDMLLALNITIALVILLVGMYILRPLELSAFPSILLITTLFRLSLNIASTRMILLHGNEGTAAAGKVIQSFGGFVVGGNFVVGIIVFLILVLINFMVIVKGAGRIAEVAARFTLDAMPGKQMSIDADLNAGIIEENEAKARRIEITRESEYYGAMDGANKFVKGDAVAGLVITAINIIGGLIIGVFQNDMSFSAAAQTYTLLTVGDGLVSQIPALIISTAAGIIVTRAGSEANLGQEISAQLLFQPRAVGIASVVLFGFGLVPGMPTVPFLVLSGLAGTLAYYFRRVGSATDEVVDAGSVDAESAGLPDTFRPLPPVDLLSLEVGYGLIPLVDVEQNGELLDRIKAIRRQVAEDVGILVPSIHIQDNMQLRPGEYVIHLKGNHVARGELMTNYYLAMNPGAGEARIEGVPTKEPTYGLPAVWIKPETREKAMAEGYTVVDLTTVVTTHLSDVIRRHAHELLGRQEVQQLLDNLKETHPKVVEELVPNLLPLGSVVKVLQNLLREQVPIRDLLAILETLADWAPTTKDLDLLSEYARQALARTISGMYQGPDGSLPVLVLDHSVEQILSEAMQQTPRGHFLAMEPGQAQQIVNALTGQLDAVATAGVQPVVLCSAPVRMPFKKLADRAVPHLAVLSYDEVASATDIQSLGTVRISDAN